MAIAVQQMDPAAHLPLILGVLRRLEVATVIDRLISPYPTHVLSCGRGGEALVLAILVWDHALYKVGKRFGLGHMTVNTCGKQVLLTFLARKSAWNLSALRPCCA